MKNIEKAIESTATIDAQQRLVLDEPLPVVETTRVRVIILFPKETDRDEKEWLRAASYSPKRLTETKRNGFGQQAKTPPSSF
ncbi:MAG: hypothetical protein AB1397_00870 [bacterium]